MTKSLKLAALLALSFAASAVGAAIAAQGNAALAELRNELKDTVARQLKPLLPAPVVAAPVTAKR